MIMAKTPPIDPETLNPRVQGLTDPEVSSEFARGKARAKAKGTPEGYDPDTGERASVTYRQIFNETNGDESRAKDIFREVAKAGGYGNVSLDQALDVRGLTKSVEAHKESVDKGIDFVTGERLDKYGVHHHKQAAQHQDNLVNAVGEALERLKRG